MTSMLRRFALSVLFAAMFALINVFVPPEYFSYVFTAYIIVIILFSTFMSFRAVRRTMREIEHVNKGKRLYVMQKEEIAKIAYADPCMKEDMLKLAKASTLSLTGMFAMIIVFMLLFGTLRDLVVNTVADATAAALGELPARFLGFFLLYLLLAILSYAFLLSSQIYARKAGAVQILQTYTVTERGIVADNRIALRFPLKAKKVIVNRARKFVEIRTHSEALSTVAGIRLYAHDPAALWNAIKNKVEAEEVEETNRIDCVVKRT